jgi:oligoribonuclease (3'-5' exoribonuclease)
MMLLNKRFYHRHVDVSALYEAYELAMGTDIRKPNTGGHRALADARGSIELFKQFKENFQ